MYIESDQMPKVLVKINPLPTKVKLLITKKITTNQTYSTSDIHRKPKPVPHDPIVMPSQLQLRPFYCQNNYYLVDQPSGYIFTTDNYNQPIGQLIEHPPKNNTRNLLPNQKIQWFVKYDLDVVIS
jgi:hypothetical protein